MKPPVIIKQKITQRICDKTVGSLVIVSFLYIQRLIIGILYPLKKYVLL